MSRGPLEEFLALAAELGAKLGPLLVQLPPQLPVDLERLERFLSIIPTGERWVLEVRHPSWQTAAVYACWAERGVALCVPVGGRLRPTWSRRRRSRTCGSTPAARRRVASRSRSSRGGPAGSGAGRSGKEVYAYFNNDREGHAVHDAARLRALLRLER